MTRTARQNYDSLLNTVYRSSHPENKGELFKGMNFLFN